MGVDKVEAVAFVSKQSPQAPGRRQVLARSGGEGEEVDLDPPSAHLVDLVADPLAALRSAAVGLEVGDDEDSHAVERIRAKRSRPRFIFRDSREAFVPGTLLAIRRVGGLPPGLTSGLEALL